MAGKSRLHFPGALYHGMQFGSGKNDFDPDSDFDLDT